MAISQPIDVIDQFHFSNFKLSNSHQLRTLLQHCWRETYGDNLTEDQLKLL